MKWRHRIEEEEEAEEEEEEKEKGKNGLFSRGAWRLGFGIGSGFTTDVIVYYFQLSEFNCCASVILAIPKPLGAVAATSQHSLYLSNLALQFSGIFSASVIR